MKLLLKDNSYENSIKFAKKLSGVYDKSVIFHCYWNGQLNEKHLISIKSCYYFNVLYRKHKIILWLNNNSPNNINEEISKYCEIKQFSLENEKINTSFIKTHFYYNKTLSYYSDVVRYLILYNYGGCWFDLDCFILRSFDPIFKNYEKEICVYQWETRNYPNGAIFISLEPKSVKMKNNINFIINRNKGWGFQEAQLHNNLALDMLVLPCSWFDPEWISSPTAEKENFKVFFKEQEKYIDIQNFHNGSFCYHWHNKWNCIIEKNSPMYYLNKDLDSKLI